MTTLGILGGLGPMATAYLLELIIDMTDAKTDQEHLDVIVFNRPNVPDRSAFILGKSTLSPIPSMIDTAEKLEALNCSHIAMPCITAHSFLPELQESVKIPFIDMAHETAAELKKANKKNVGIMATSGTISAGTLQKALENAGITPHIPNDDMQQLVMEIIYDDVKAGNKVDMNKFNLVTDELISLGCDSIILGCTELSIVKRDEEIGDIFIDVLDVLSKRSIELCGGKVKKEFENLI